jgi:hypothetical protein
MLRVEIRWIDSGTYYRNDEKGWQTPSEVMSSATLSEVSTVGWLLGEDDDAYYVGLSRIPGRENLVFGTQVIYKPNVTGVTRLRARTLADANEED